MVRRPSRMGKDDKNGVFNPPLPLSYTLSNNHPNQNV